MAISIDKDPITGLEVDGLYYRIDKINFNDKDFQIVLTGYASEDSFRNGSRPISQPRAYTLLDFNKEELANSNIYEFAYRYTKTIEGFENAIDVFEGNQKEETKVGEIEELKHDSIVEEEE